MAQAQVASVFARAYAVTDEVRYADAAKAALDPLVRPVEADEIVTPTPEGPILQEYPARSRSDVLNGWIYALWGLRDAAVLLDHRAAADLFAASTHALASRLDDYDLGWWSRYSLYGSDVAKPFYHRLHVRQLHVMADLTGDARFSEVAARWARYDTPVRASRAIAWKATEVLASCTS
jgi:hypothetical protein